MTLCNMDDRKRQTLGKNACAQRTMTNIHVRGAEKLLPSGVFFLSATEE
jgi:hypothetical protein